MKAAEVKSLLKVTRNQKILVIGDVMLDEFHWCKVSRISPEAPVPVCRVESTTLVPGGAANVANNILALGSQAILLGIIGNDSSGHKLTNQLNKLGIETRYLWVDKTRPTILKSRIIAHHQQVVRVDREDSSHLSASLQSKILKALPELLEHAGAVVLSDYLKGLLSPSFTQKIIAMANKKNIPVVVDPKGNDYKKYTGATVLTPNFQEFQQATKKTTKSEEHIVKEALKLIKNLKLGSLLVTRSEKGMSIISRTGEKTDIPTVAKEVFDITGAGDTVIALFSIALSAGIDVHRAAYLANAAAGLVVGKLGTATATLDEIEHFLCHT